MSIIGAYWTDNGRDWHGNDGWDIQLVYATLSDDNFFGLSKVGDRVQSSRKSERNVLVRVDYALGQSVPPNDPARGVYMQFLQRMCQDSRYKNNAYGYIIGNEYNMKGENENNNQTPITPSWYARIFNGYGAPIADTGNAYQCIKTFHPNARVLVGPVGPWSPDGNSDDGSTYSINMPWLNYFKQVCRNIYNMASAKGTIDGFAIHTYGRTGTDGTANGGKNEPHIDVQGGGWATGAWAGFTVYKNWRDIINQFDSNVPIWITETNTRTDAPSSSSYPQGWYLEALKEIASAGSRFKALCWFVDQNLGNGWSNDCLTNPVSKCADANNDFNAALTGGSPRNAAALVSQSVPNSMVVGQRYNVSVVMKNTGINTWTGSTSNPYRLGSQNPQDNSRWGLARVNLPSSMAQNSQVTFNFTVTAPSTPGIYNFQWRMVQEGVELFGDYTPNVAVNVATSAPSPNASKPVFDPSFYLAVYPDLQNAFGAQNFASATQHWLEHGISEGRISSPAFDVRYYLGQYPDLQNAFGAQNFAAAIQHWLDNGIREGRISSPIFDVRYYLGQYPDLKNAFGTNYAAAIQHWLDNGIREGRRGSAAFAPAYYLATYPDVAAAYGATNYLGAIVHWLLFGKKEGRRGAP